MQQIATSPTPLYSASMLNASNRNWTCHPGCPRCCCAPDLPPSALRVGLFTVAGLIAAAGVVSSLLAFFVLLRPGVRFSVSPLYLVGLSLCDGVLCAMYIVIFVLRPVSAYFEWYELYWLAWQIMVVAWWLSAVAQLGIPLLLVMASLERWVMVSQSSFFCLRRIVTNGFRRLFSAFAFIAVILLRYPILLAVDVKETDCPQRMRMFYAKRKTDTPDWYNTYDIVCSALQIFVPVPILIGLNVLVFCRRRSSTRTVERALSLKGATAKLLMSERIRREVREERAKLRSAMFTMAVVVSTQLVCNCMQVTLKGMETFAFEMIISDEVDSRQWSDFYVSFADVNNFLFTVCSAARLPIYYVCNMEIREQVKALFRCCGWCPRHKPSDTVAAVLAAQHSSADAS